MSFEFLYGMWSIPRPSASLLITFPSIRRLPLMCALSPARAPVFSVLSRRSEPRSCRERQQWLRPSLDERNKYGAVIAAWLVTCQINKVESGESERCSAFPEFNGDPKDRVRPGGCVIHLGSSSLPPRHPPIQQDFYTAYTVHDLLVQTCHLKDRGKTHNM